MNQRLIPAPIALVFSELEDGDDRYEREYQLLSGADDDAIGQWLKMAKAKGDTQDTDKVLLQMMVEMHRKIDALELLIKNEKPKRISLSDETLVKRIGFELFEIETPSFEVGKAYYARLTMPVYPQRDVAVFIEAISSTQAEIKRIHDRDLVEWNAYVTARERIMIREMKGLS
jgi:hypothetical protein